MWKSTCRLPIYIYIYIYNYIYIYRKSVFRLFHSTVLETFRKNKETILSSLQACFVITNSSGDFIVKNIFKHCLYTLHICITASIAVNLNALFNYIVMSNVDNSTLYIKNHLQLTIEKTDKGITLWYNPLFNKNICQHQYWTQIPCLSRQAPP